MYSFNSNEIQLNAGQIVRISTVAEHFIRILLDDAFDLVFVDFCFDLGNQSRSLFILVLSASGIFSHFTSFTVAFDFISHVGNSKFSCYLLLIHNFPINISNLNATTSNSIEQHISDEDKCK